MSELVYLIDAVSGLTSNHNDFCALLNLIALLLIFIERFRVRSTLSSPSLYMFAPNQLLFGSKPSILMALTAYNILKLISIGFNLNQAVCDQHRTYF